MSQRTYFNQTTHVIIKNSMNSQGPDADQNALKTLSKVTVLVNKTMPMCEDMSHLRMLAFNFISIFANTVTN